MRKGVIDLDWLESEISLAENKYLEIPFMRENQLSSAFMKLSVLTVVRSKCTPIEEPVLFDGEPIPDLCVNDWNDRRFCEKVNRCKMCQTK